MLLLRSIDILLTERHPATRIMPQNSATYIHSGDSAYAPPVLRAPSPSSSIGTDYGPDETTPEEASMSNFALMHSINHRLRLNEPSAEELKAERDPLLPKPRDAQHEQRELLLLSYTSLAIYLTSLNDSAICWRNGKFAIRSGDAPTYRAV